MYFSTSYLFFNYIFYYHLFYLFFILSFFFFFGTHPLPGNCTLPNLCTCEKGWAGHDCSYALCAQECNNGGKCVAPDVCQCMLTQNTWVDGRLGGGRPLFRDEFGDPQNTGKKRAVQNLSTVVVHRLYHSNKFYLFILWLSFLLNPFSKHNPKQS